MTRCQRADGSFYGTGGTCRKGREVSDLIHKPKDLANFLKKEGRLLGEGAFGKVHDVGDGVVVKTGYIGAQESKVMEALKHIENIPRLISSTVKAIDDDEDMPQLGVLAMTKVPGIPLEVSIPRDMPEIWDKTIMLLKKIHKAGYSHNDLHGGNIMWNGKNRQVSIIDFGQSSKNPKMQLAELVGLSKQLGKSTYGPLSEKFLVKVQKVNSQKNFFALSDKEAKRELNKLWDEIP